MTMPEPARPDATTAQNTGQAFMAGKGEMASLIRAHDWSASSLGDPALWPQSLRTVVRLMLNTGHPMYVWWGPELTCLYNDAYRESIGPERHPGSLGRPAREVWAEIWEVIFPQIEQVLSGGGATWHVDHLVPITRHGRREDVYWTYSYSPIDDERAPGGIGGVLVQCTETTQQVLAARELASERDRLAALHESEMRFRSALHAGGMGAWETDYQTLTRSWTPEGMALFGLSLPDGRGHVGGPDDEYVAALHPDHRHLAAGFRELADRQDSFPAEYWIVRADGSKLWLEGRGMVISRMPDGRAHRLVSIMADATERKRAEERLLIEHQRLELALGAGRMGAYDMDMRDNVLWWSVQTYRLFGVSEQDFVPTPAHVLALLHPDDREDFIRRRAEAIEGHRPFVHEFRILRPDGTQAWLGHRGHVEYDAGGRPVRIFGVTMDITERKLVETRLQDADRQKDRFIAMLAHELRNPLAPIRNAIAVLRKIGGADATSAWCHDVIDRQVSQMAHLLDDLLDASRLNHGHLRLRMQPLQLATAIDRAIEIARPVIDAGGHSFALHIPARPIELEGDLTRLAQVFSNILINAAKYTPRGGAIALTLEREGQQALVSVTDTGIGIESHHGERIFEMFGQVESSLARAQGGQGIGLALAKALVEMHGGTIAASSEGLGKGSRFEVRLPLAAMEVEANPDATGAGESSAAAGCRVLVVDDMRDSADSLALAVQALGHEVEVAYSGEAALRKVEATRPDIVLLDLGMPGMDGYEVCRRIRATPWGHEVLLVAQTGWGNDNDREATRRAGFDHHLVKPVELGALAALLESASPSSR